METDTEPSPEKKKASPSSGSFWHRLTSLPAFHLSDWIIGFVGLVVGLAIWWFNIERHELIFAVNPVRTVVVNSESASDLKVEYKGRAITGDVSAVQISIWNQGKKSIWAADVLETVQITIKGAPILDITAFKTNRAASQVNLDKEHTTNGVVGVSWKILEQGDACGVQIIYAGKITTPVQVSGIIEGQKRLEELKLADKNRISFDRPFWGYYALISSPCLAFLGYVHKRKFHLKETKPLLYLATMVCLICGSGVAFGLREFFRGRPPFL